MSIIPMADKEAWDRFEFLALHFIYVEDERYVKGTRMRVKDDADLRQSIIKHNR